ncbi:hypothetical protein JZ751_015247 [Albula glossodonta]|uniref:Uncharacterized protein n=1 Tax=Albula glossodonta TaxID=121402 RepID=A0A8T2NS44_9TELE|nr:hypothetical protein JZ751_015247 [Albula glossodonta]
MLLWDQEAEMALCGRSRTVLVSPRAYANAPFNSSAPISAFPCPSGLLLQADPLCMVEHGFPSQPSALAYDPKLQLMAIGTKSGAVKVVVCIFPMLASSVSPARPGKWHLGSDRRGLLAPNCSPSDCTENGLRYLQLVPVVLGISGQVEGGAGLWDSWPAAISLLFGGCQTSVFIFPSATLRCYYLRRYDFKGKNALISAALETGHAFARRPRPEACGSSSLSIVLAWFSSSAAPCAWVPIRPGLEHPSPSGLVQPRALSQRHSSLSQNNTRDQDQDRLAYSTSLNIRPLDQQSHLGQESIFTNMEPPVWSSQEHTKGPPLSHSCTSCMGR